MGGTNVLSIFKLHLLNELRSRDSRLPPIEPLSSSKNCVIAKMFFSAKITVQNKLTLTFQRLDLLIYK